MITEFTISRRSLKELLDSLRDVFPATSPLDLNIEVTDESIKIYVIITETQILVHELFDGDEIDVNIQQKADICLNPDILHSLVNEAPDGTDITVQIASNRYLVRANKSGFKTPTSFSLYRHVESEFQPLPEDQITGMHRIGDLNRRSLLDNLNMLGTISDVVKISVNEDNIEISVTSQVEGEGQVMAELEGDHDLPISSFEYNLDIIRDYLENVKTPSEVAFSQTDSGALMLEMQANSMSSRLYLAKRLPPSN